MGNSYFKLRNCGKIRCVQSQLLAIEEMEATPSKDILPRLYLFYMNANEKFKTLYLFLLVIYSKSIFSTRLLWLLHPPHPPGALLGGGGQRGMCPFANRVEKEKMKEKWRKKNIKPLLKLTFSVIFFFFEGGPKKMWGAM